MSDALAAKSDAALVVAVARYQEQALAEIYRRHAGAVHALARRILGADGRAADVTQEVFVDLWNRPERFDPDRGNLRSFLVTVAHRRAIDYVRADTARSARERRSAAATATDGYDLERELSDLSLAAHLRQALDGIPERERRPIEMSYFGGHTYREVAVMLDEAEGTIKGRIRAGLGHLRAALAQAGIEHAGIEP